VGADYDAHLREARERIAEDSPEKQAALAAMVAAEAEGRMPASHGAQARWIGVTNHSGD
jgi:hypothetical protein